MEPDDGDGKVYDQVLETEVGEPEALVKDGLVQHVCNDALVFPPLLEGIESHLIVGAGVEKVLGNRRSAVHLGSRHDQTASGS